VRLDVEFSSGHTLGVPVQNAAAARAG
jgi:hypothetical protein